MTTSEHTPHKQIIEGIKNLEWKKLTAEDLQQLMHVVYISAKEFAEALRIAMTLHPNNANLQETAAGELQTDNLAYADFTQKGDHADFLGYFLNKHDIAVGPELAAACDTYIAACQQLPDDIRAMSIFSREAESAGIFQKILEAKDWSAPGLEEFRHYLQMHIEIDSAEGGHSDLVKEFTVDERVAPFYEARRRMYQAINRLIP